ncbi:MAG TPA: DUF4388 domain-containing protein [Thermoanaerobaculia bacterium]|nr:DUF4388 domain-containing protein [Thermoanaerobaculia bacterium]
MEFSGRLAAFPPGDLLQWAKNDRRTGALIVRRSDREKRVYFLAGEVVGCLSTDPAEFYGQYLLLHGFLDQDKLFQALSYCTVHGRRLGAALTDLGFLNPEVIQATLRQQIEDLVCDLFLWERGVFYFQSELLPEEEILPEPIHTVGLAMEGSRWLDEYHRIRRVLVHDNVVLVRGKNWQAKGLAPLDQRVAQAVDGRKSLSDLYKELRGSYFRFLEAAFRLCVNSVLDIGEVGEDWGSGTHEMSVYDLMLEQATEEQVLVARRHMAVPLDLLERIYPVWVGEPAAEEQKRMPARARDFYARLDGLTPLGEAFSGDARLRGREMDLLLLQLQKGRLALLPTSLNRLEAEADERGEPAIKRWWRRVFSSGG